MSGAHVELNRSAPPGPEKEFHIRGTPEQIQHAMHLINEKVNVPPRGGPGGGAQGKAYSRVPVYCPPQQLTLHCTSPSGGWGGPQGGAPYGAGQGSWGGGPPGAPPAGPPGGGYNGGQQQQQAWGNYNYNQWGQQQGQQGQQQPGAPGSRPPSLPLACCSFLSPSVTYCRCCSRGNRPAEPGRDVAGLLHPVLQPIPAATAAGRSRCSACLRRRCLRHTRRRCLLAGSFSRRCHRHRSAK